ncbi:hypothetical protein LLB_2631 [Legionella longbeachae D-4968]|nr:hypothetical protein LLB_2631 [Legionella longbeachae D-4968]
MPTLIVIRFAVSPELDAATLNPVIKKTKNELKTMNFDKKCFIFIFLID